MIQIQTTVTGYAGKAATLFSAYNAEARLLIVSKVTDYRPERREGCVVITNNANLLHDELFDDTHLMAAISAYYALKAGVATDGKSSRIKFSDTAALANPSNAIEQDGIDVNGPKYRIEEGISCAQVAALATCAYVMRCDGIEQTVQLAESMAETLRAFALGRIWTI